MGTFGVFILYHHFEKNYQPLTKDEKQDDFSKSCSFGRKAQSSITFEPSFSLRNICKWSSKSENITCRKGSTWTRDCMCFRSHPDVGFISLRRIEDTKHDNIIDMNSRCSTCSKTNYIQTLYMIMGHGILLLSDWHQQPLEYIKKELSCARKRK